MSTMATQRFPLSFFKKQSLLKPSIPIITLKNPMILSPRISSFDHDIQGLSIRMLHCSKTSNLSVSNKQIESTPVPGIFINGYLGLQLREAYGRHFLNLEKSQIGVSCGVAARGKGISPLGNILIEIKIMMDKKSNQTLGFGYVWFTNEEVVQSVVKEMNGDFFYGRFLFVTATKPGFPKRNPRATPYKF